MLAELTGILGWAESVISTLGAPGVGLLVALETIFPPIPSEVILPLAGFFAAQGRVDLVAVMVTSTFGAYLGALVLYGLGARLGLARSVRWLAKLPLVDAEDFERAGGWFERHGRSSIFFGRLIPGVRSLISLPAGAHRMPIPTFSLFTLAGSGAWNCLLILLGSWLGEQYALVARYAHVIDYVVYAVLAGLVVWLIVRRVRRRRSERAAGDAAA